MDARLFNRLHDKHSPHLNKEVVDGLACTDLPLAKEYVDSIIENGAAQYPPGFEYVGSEICSPIEEYNVITNVRSNSRRVFDMARTDMVLAKYQFKFNGELLYPRYLYLPYVRQGGLMFARGVQFAVSPVMTDVGFSVGTDDIFIPLLRAKVNIYRENYIFRVDGVRVPHSVLYSSLHNKGGKKSNNTSSMIHLGRVQSTLAHYLFCRYGFYETFERYTQAQPIVIRQEQYDENLWPKDQYVVCQSGALTKPPGMKGRRDYSQIATRLMVLVKREHFNQVVKSLIAAFYYVVDHFPDLIDDPQLVGEQDQWKVFMGYILWGDEQMGKLFSSLQTHLNSLDGYVDLEGRYNLRERGIFCENIYDLMVYMLDHMQDLLNENATKISSLYGKRLEVLRYVLRDINHMLFEFLFKITGNNKKVLTKDDYNDILGQFFKPKQMVHISSRPEHVEISSVSSPGDNKFFKITSIIVQQSDLQGGGKGQKSKVLGPAQFLDASFAEAGGYCFLPKSNPAGNARINPTVQLGPNHTIERKEKFIELIDHVQELIARR